MNLLFDEERMIGMPFYTIRAIDAHTWHIEDIFHDYMYLVEGSEQAALIDTGMGFRGLDEAVRSLTDKPVIVLNTHGHLDHTGANGQFDTVHIMRADEALMYEHMSENYRGVSIPAFIAETGAVVDEKTTDELIRLPKDFNVSYIEDGQVIDLGGRALKVIAVPGHTQGSAVFMDEKNGQLFSGDMLCTMGIMLNFDCSTDIGTFVASMMKLKKNADGVTAVYGGHHVWPIQLDYCDKYIECAGCLLKDNSGSVTEHGTFGEFYRYHFEDISLTYVERTLK